MFTLALGVILTISIERWESVTGGTDGLIGIPPPAAIGPIAFTSLVAQYYLVLVFLALTIYVSVSIAQSLVGRSFIAIAEREPGARHRHRCWPDDEAVVCDLGDVCRAGRRPVCVVPRLHRARHEQRRHDLPHAALPDAGGAGSLARPLVGTLLISMAMQALQAFDQYLLGPLLVVIMTFFPNGLAGIWGSLEDRGGSQSICGRRCCSRTGGSPRSVCHRHLPTTRRLQAHARARPPQRLPRRRPLLGGVVLLGLLAQRRHRAVNSRLSPSRPAVRLAPSRSRRALPSALERCRTKWVQPIHWRVLVSQRADTRRPEPVARRIDDEDGRRVAVVVENPRRK